jgi:outer membrane usher protein FimD/PapC
MYIPKRKEHTTMTEKQMKQIQNQLPKGEKINRCYRAFEGDIRVIIREPDGSEVRYTVSFDANDNATIKEF